jgi:hypothetical protein
MTILDGKKSRVYLTQPTADDRWMVAYAEGGKLILMSEFLGSQLDAQAICVAFNERELQRYVMDSRDQVISAITANRPSIFQISEHLGIKIQDA